MRKMSLDSLIAREWARPKWIGSNLDLGRSEVRHGLAERPLHGRRLWERLKLLLHRLKCLEHCVCLDISRDNDAKVVWPVVPLWARRVGRK